MAALQMSSESSGKQEKKITENSEFQKTKLMSSVQFVIE